MAPQAVIFDLGKVLLDFDYDRAYCALADQANLGAEDIQRVLVEDGLLHRFESGQVSSEVFFRLFQGETGFHAGYAVFRQMFADIFRPIEPMIAFQADLKASGVRCFIFSNTNEIAVTHIQQRYPFFGGFDGYIYSFEHGSMKPQPQLYHAVEAATGLHGPDLFYIDDRPENVETGRAFRWNAVVHSDPAGTLAAARALGLPASG